MSDNEKVEFRLNVEGAPWLTERVIFLTHAGSIAYGTAIEGSDVDIRGIAIPPPYVEHSIMKPFEQHREKAGDTVIYGLRQFIRQLVKQAPNIVEMLFIDPKHHLLTTPAFVPLVKSRQLFLTKALAATHLGMVQASQKEFAKLTEKEPAWAPDPRKCLTNSLRLLLQVNDILLGREPMVERPESDGLREIRVGEAPTKEVLEAIQHMMRVVNDNFAKSTIPQAVDVKAADALYRMMLEHSWDYEVQVPIMGNWKSQKLTYGGAKITAKNLVRE